MRVLVSVTARDAANLGTRYPEGATTLGPFERVLREAGVCDIRRRAVTAADVEETGSAWAKRLGIPTRRPAWLLTGRTAGPVVG